MSVALFAGVLVLLMVLLSAAPTRVSLTSLASRAPAPSLPSAPHSELHHQDDADVTTRAMTAAPATPRPTLVHPPVKSALDPPPVARPKPQRPAVTARPPVVSSGAGPLVFKRFDDRDVLPSGALASQSFPDVHALPLASGAGALRREAKSWDELKVTNIIAKQYAKVSPLPPNDPIRSRFAASGDVWSDRGALAETLGRWIVLNREMRSGKRPARMVTVNPVGQLCNRLMAITSGFVFALMTGRGLHIDDSGFYCAMSDLFETPGFDWVNYADGDAGDSHSIQNPESGVWEETEPLLCANYADAYPQKSIIFSINQYLVPYLASNPHYRDALFELFGGPDLFTPSARFLYQPIPEIIKMRDDYVARHFANAFVVGMQVRSGADFTDNFMSDHDWDLYGRCAAGITPNTTLAAAKPLVFFIATDTAQGREAAAKKFGKGKVLFGPGEFLLSNHPRGVQMALLDLLLLAAANDRVTTAWSSYGYFAAGFSGLPAATVVDEVSPSKWLAKPGDEQRFMGVPHKSDKRRQCVRLPVHQPCFHKYASWGADKATCFKPEWYEREMLNGRYC